MPEPLVRGVSFCNEKGDTSVMNTTATSKLRAPHEPRSDEPQVGASGFGVCEERHHVTWLDRIDHVVRGQGYGVCSSCRGQAA